MERIKSEFVSRMAGEMGQERAQRLCGALEQTEPVTAVRVNPAKCGDSLPEVTAGAEPVAWSGDQGFYLAQRPEFIFDPELHQGRYYVQDASSMAIGEVIRRLKFLENSEGSESSEGSENRPLAFLDACAAPGGKTTAALAALPQGSLVVANEFDRRRVDVLCENLVKWGSENTVVTRGDTSRLAALGETFDLVAVDAPCSGEGMMRKDATAREQWSPQLVEQCAALQREILQNVWATLRPGGFLIYSTCTFNRLENEENLSFLVEQLGAEAVRIDFPAQWGVGEGIDTPYPALRFLPSEVRGEGLFMAVVRKPGVWRPAIDQENALRAKAAKGGKGMKGSKGSKSPKASVPCAREVGAWLFDTSAYELEAAADGTISALPRRWLATIRRVQATADVVRAGLQLAAVKGRDAAPTHSLALSGALASDAFPRCEVDRATALAYLRRDPVALPDGSPTGYLLLTYGSHPLGFVKNIGSRTNSLLPLSFRILKR